MIKYCPITPTPTQPDCRQRPRLSPSLHRRFCRRQQHQRQREQKAYESNCVAMPRQKGESRGTTFPTLHRSDFIMKKPQELLPHSMVQSINGTKIKVNSNQPSNTDTWTKYLCQRCGHCRRRHLYHERLTTAAEALPRRKTGKTKKLNRQNAVQISNPASRRHSNQTFLTWYFQPHRPDIAVPVNLLRGQHKAADVSAAALNKLLTVGTAYQKSTARLKPSSPASNLKPAATKCQITRTFCTQAKQTKLTEEIKMLTDANAHVSLTVPYHFIVN